jgi:hypothetical protein
MICAHSVAQIVRCAALFSFADHLAAGPATAEAVARVEGLDADATFRLMRACAAYGLMGYDKDRGFSATPLLATPRYVQRKMAGFVERHLFVRCGHGAGRSRPLGSASGIAIMSRCTTCATYHNRMLTYRQIDLGGIARRVDVGQDDLDQHHPTTNRNPTC